MKYEFLMSDVYLAHRPLAASVSIPISCETGDFRLKGTVVQILDLSSPCITLLTDSCTLEHKVEDDAAERLFEEAAEKIIREGGSFYTVLRPNWALPAVRWDEVSGG